ncbi:hypothetical protein HJFPF1_00308 [Paramyrothecium foliicola]|nr:hypothetical protein HJFPF1_00308 [Paramyrothecium foliicola]
MHQSTLALTPLLGMAALVSAAPSTFGKACGIFQTPCPTGFTCVPNNPFCTGLFCQGSCQLSLNLGPQPLPFTLPFPFSIPPLTLPTVPTTVRPPAVLSTLTIPSIPSVSIPSVSVPTISVPSISVDPTILPEPTLDVLEPIQNEYQFCGGFTPFPAPDCPRGTYCADDPRNPGSCGMACDAPGICIPIEAQFCGGFAGFPCPDGLECFDDPDDDCDPLNGGSDCAGICL